MLTINDFIKKYHQIMEAFKKHGFHGAILFKGFNFKEEHNLNLLVNDFFTSDIEHKPQTLRKLELKDELSNLLNCKIVLSTLDQMENYYLKKLNSINSVKLTEEVPESELIKVFGKNWTFNHLAENEKFYFWGSTPAAESRKNTCQLQEPHPVLSKN